MEQGHGTHISSQENAILQNIICFIKNLQISFK